MSNLSDNHNAIVSYCDIKDDSKDGLLKNTKVVIKDNISTKGVKTTSSSKMLENYVPVFNATVIDKIVDAGGHIIAKAAMDEFGMGGFGTTAVTGSVLNPLDTKRVSGGSSAGSATLVADKTVDVSLGTDTGDSMRIPASYCGIVGFKPSYGRISRYGVMPYAASLDHVGIFANNVKTAATMLEVVSGYDPHDETSSHKEVEDYSSLNSSLENIKIGIISNVVESISNEEILKGFNSLVSKLADNNIIVENVRFKEELFNTLHIVYKIIANAEAFSNHSSLNGVPFGLRNEGNTLDEIMLNTRSNNLGFQVKYRHLLGAYSLSEENYESTFNQAKKVRRLIVDDINDKLEEYDFFIAPASSRIAPMLDEDYASSNIADNYMVMDNFSGHPGIVLPMVKVDDMPVGVYVSSKAFNEKQLLTLSNLIEELVGEI